MHSSGRACGSSPHSQVDSPHSPTPHLPQVCEAVQGAVGEVGRRLAAQLATKQDLQTLSLKVGGGYGGKRRRQGCHTEHRSCRRPTLPPSAAQVSSKVSREEVERLLRAHRASLAPPTTAADPGPAAGTKLRCISCDTDLQPFLFAAAPGVIVGGGGQLAPAPGATADLRYSQLPAASPARNAGLPWTAAVGVAGPGSPQAAAALGAGGEGAAVQLPAAALSARPSASPGRQGAPAR